MNPFRPLSRLKLLSKAFVTPAHQAPVRLFATMAVLTDPKTYKFNHTMLRVKDPQRSVKFYEFLGMKLVKKFSFPDMSFDIYFMGYDTAATPSQGLNVFDREGLIELTHNYGTEKDAEFKVNNGNAEPHRGFGHTCVSVDNIQAACKRLEDAGYKFQKTLSQGKMRHIAFALDPDGYWVEIVGQKSVDEAEKETSTDTGRYLMNHSMIRVKDAQKSLKFYQDVLGMSLLRSHKNEAAGFDLYFLGYPGKKGVPKEDGVTHDREAMLELTWNHGTEKDDAFHYHNGNEEPKGFGHLGITVDDVEAACARLEKLGVEFKKRPQDGKMKNVAFVLDPDKYWIEIVQNESISGKPNFPSN